MSIFCVNYDARHTTTTSPNDIIWDHDENSFNHKSCNISMYLTHFQCVVIAPVTRVDDGIPVPTPGPGSTENPPERPIA
jgi:hypothetical protein